MMNGVLRYIHDHIRERLQAAEVAEQFGFSRWYFCARFREFTGKTFVEYVRHYRIQLAALDILAGKKVLDAAVDCGYDSVSGFTKAFMKEYGCMPAEYKRQARESHLYYEQRRISMYQSSDRCAMLREEAIERPNCYMKYTWGKRSMPIRWDISIRFSIRITKTILRRVCYSAMVRRATRM